ncbi:efflux RND transporter periplasmic adaptor subunit [Paraferrimonas sp. SM1919]|uniref:efflux RND transporter periplasmic adaptor subunit n=1 Tax=Paraferrimonas sp. SM1919 TaxID=2662263 RepID=UPI0013D23307|nr:efflux RND transporter periplasmic adaptor subunit [Paraferrimonas sp. SM1919]
MKAVLTTIAISTTLLIAGCDPHQQTFNEPEGVIQPVKLFTIDHNLSVKKRTFPGKVASTKKVDIAFRVSGQLINFYKTAGSTLKKGELIAQLDDRDARNTLADRQARFDIAKLQFERSDKLYAKQLTSRVEYDTAKAQLTSAKAALELAKSNLSYHQVFAPYDGTIASINADNFQVIGMNQPVITFQKADQLDVKIQVPEYLAKYLNSEQKIQSVVTFASLPEQQFAISLREYATEVTPGTQSFEVTYTLTPPANTTILPGMSAEVYLALIEPQTTEVIVPIQAVSTDDHTGESLVWKYDPLTSVVNPIPIKIGEITKDGIQVYGDLAHGDKIVSAGITQLTPNLKVKPLVWKRGV